MTAKAEHEKYLSIYFIKKSDNIQCSYDKTTPIGKQEIIQKLHTKYRMSQKAVPIF